MERLQEAIQKARAQQTSKNVPHEKAPAAVNPSSTPKIDEAWSNLTRFNPDIKILKRNRIVATEGSPEAIPYDMLRTRSLQKLHKEGWKRVLVTSPNTGCGKTSTCCNLAVSLGRNPRLRTIIFDLDMRRPSVGKLFGHNSHSSFHSVLEDRVSFEDNAVRIGSNLAICTNRTPVHHPAELLQSDKTAKLLDEIDKKYQPDVMLFDLPPMLSNDDTMSFIRKTDCALLIAAAETTTIEQIDICEQDLANEIPMLGVVLNKCRYTEKKKDNKYGKY